MRHDSSGYLGRMPCLETWRNVDPGGFFLSLRNKDHKFVKYHLWKTTFLEIVVLVDYQQVEKRYFRGFSGITNKVEHFP